MTEEEEGRIYEAQGEEVERLYGREAAGIMNLGWGVTDDEVASKVYLPGGHKIITSRIVDGAVVHAWSDY